MANSKPVNDKCLCVTSEKNLLTSVSVDVIILFHCFAILYGF